MNISWPRVRSLLRKEWRQLFRDPRSKRVVFASPILQLVLFGYAVNTDVNNTSMFVVDHDVTAESRALVDAFTAAGWFRVTGTSDRSADLLYALDRGTARIAIEIPPGFSQRLSSGNARVQVLVDGTNSNTATVAQGYAARIIQQFGAQYAPADAPAGIDLRARAWYNPGLESRVYNIPAVVGTILMLMSLLLTALAVVRERELGTLDQLMVSPLTPGELVLGKTLPVVAIALIEAFEGPAGSNGAPAAPERAAESIRETVRDADTACRLSDGVYAIILEDTPENGAVWTVERVRRNLVSRHGSHTMWAGVACYPAHAFSTEELLDQARGALESAREWKQDRIEVAISE